jgi:hypothetical protein
LIKYSVFSGTKLNALTLPDYAAKTYYKRNGTLPSHQERKIKDASFTNRAQA